MIKAIFLMQADDSKGLLASAVDFFYGKGFTHAIPGIDSTIDKYLFHFVFSLSS